MTTPTPERHQHQTGTFPRQYEQPGKSRYTIHYGDGHSLIHLPVRNVVSRRCVNQHQTGTFPRQYGQPGKSRCTIHYGDGHSLIHLPVRNDNHQHQTNTRPDQHQTGTFPRQYEQPGKSRYTIHYGDGHPLIRLPVRNVVSRERVRQVGAGQESVGDWHDMGTRVDRSQPGDRMVVIVAL